jgi:PAS domain S-box-containing protein
MEEIFPGNSEMARRMRELDWSKTTLGPVERWPQSLRTSVSTCLECAFPIILWWGPELAILYNDEYRPMLGPKHPRALGQPGARVWSEIWDVIAPMLSQVMERGEPTRSRDLLLHIDRGYPEEAYFSFSYSPIHAEEGQVGGVFCPVIETTDKVIGERRLRTLRDLAARYKGSQSEEAAYDAAASILAANLQDVPFALIYRVDEHEPVALLKAASGIGAGTPASPDRVVIDDSVPDVWSLSTVARTGRPAVVSDLAAKFATLPAGAWKTPPTRAVVLPVLLPGQEQPHAILVAAVSPMRALDEDYRTFFELVATQIAAGLADAKALEEERRRAEALAELDRVKTTFFSNVSHEFRTPLTLMIGPLQDLIAKSDSKLPQEAAAALDVAHRNGLRLLKLVNTLLDFSRIEAGRIDASYEPTDLAAYTSELASAFRSAIEKAGLELVVQSDPLPELVYVDRDMWEKIVLNLVSNAFKFTFEGRITVGLEWHGDRVELRVTDTGVGIPESDLPRMFQRFHRVKHARARTHEGTGIGLAFVQELARLHGGSVSVSSQEGSGTTFTVNIRTGTSHLPSDRLSVARQLGSTSVGAMPFVEEALRWLPTKGGASPQIPAPASVAFGAGGSDSASRILIADDNADMRDYLSRILGGSYRVATVADGRAALEAIKSSPPDLLLADVMMPELDGFALLAAIRADARSRSLPVILLSARAGEEARIEGLHAGADEYLVKPFSARELLATVASQLRLARLRTESEQAVRSAQAYLAAIVDSADDAILSKDLDGIIQSCNRAAERLFGYSAEELVGRPVRMLIPPERQAEEDEILAKLRRGERVEHFETVRVAKDGRRIDISLTISPLRDVTGTIVGASKIARDITAARQAALERTRLLQENAAVTETLNRVGTIVASDLDKDKVVQAVTDAATELTTAEFGAFFYNVVDESGESYTLYTISGVPREAFSKFQMPRNTEVFEPTFKGTGVVRSADITKDPRYGRNPPYHGMPPGNLPVHSYLAVPVRGRSGDAIGGLFFGHSEVGRFSEQHERLALGVASWASVALENARLYSSVHEASRLKDEFLASLSHELRTPLNAILGYARMLRSGIVAPERQEKAIETIERNATSLTQIVEDVLDISRIVSGKIRLNVQPVDFPDIVRGAVDAITPAADAKGVRVETVVNPQATPISGDPERLQQILWNLLSNAVKFTIRGGRIQVRLDRVDSHVEVVVSDTGIGIAPEFLPHVFERFRQADAGMARERGGLGLGLSIAQQLAEMHGGTIEASSAGVGQGATFRLKMPVMIVQLRAGEEPRNYPRLEAARRQSQNVDLGHLHVLVVDDDRDALSLVVEVLEAAAARVTAANSAQEALASLDTDLPDVMVADLGMPHVNGFEFIGRVRRHANPGVRALPAAALTAYARSDDRMRALRAGFDIHLAKPIDPAELVTTIAALAKRFPADSLTVRPEAERSTSD